MSKQNMTRCLWDISKANEMDVGAAEHFVIEGASGVPKETGDHE